MAGGLGTRGRFAAAYLILGAVVGVGLGSLIVLLQRDKPPPPPPWSSWQPTANDAASRLTQIASHVAPRYRLRSGNQLVDVRVQNGTNFQGVAVVKADDVKKLDKAYGRDDTAVYALCGNPETCKIDEGTPSVARGTVLRREALELALYTLEYERSIDNVLVFFPPGNGEKSFSSTLFFRRDDLSSSLHHPLRRTLPQAQPPVPGKIQPAERETVDDLTGDKLYKYLGIAQNVIVIQPPA